MWKRGWDVAGRKEVDVQRLYILLMVKLGSYFSVIREDDIAKEESKKENACE